MKKTIYKQLLAFFFITMIFLTILSRVMDTMMIAKVSTGRIQRKNINNIIEGDAVVEAGDIALITSEKGFRIEQVFVMDGSQTTPETELFQYQIESIQNMKKETQAELDKLLLMFKQEQLKAQVIPSVSEVEAAQLEVQVAEKEVALLQKKYDEKQTKYLENIKYLEDEFQKKKHLTEEELKYQNEKSYRSNEQNYNTAQANRDRDIKAAERKVEDAKSELDQLEQAEADEAEISKAQKKLDRAQDDLDDLYDQWESTLDSAEDQMDIDEYQADNIDSGWTSSQISLEEEYRQNKEKEEQILQAAADEVEKAQTVLETSKQNMVLAQKKDTAVQAESSKQKQIAELNQKSNQIDIETKKMEIAAIDKLLEQKGIVKAGLSGTVVEVGLKIGQITTGEETVQIATGNFRIRGTFKKDGDISVRAGSDVAITAGGDNLNATVDVVNLSQDDKGEFVATIDYKDAVVGMTVRYKYTEKSDMFDKVIPLGAIHKDLKGYYCLAVQEQKGILGTEFTAARVNLEIIFSGNKEAAVEGNLGNDTQIIVETDTILQEGDRVRRINNNEET